MSEGQLAAGKSVGGPSACASCERLRRELEATRGALRKSQARAAELEAQLGDLRRSVFGRKSEAATPGRDDPPMALTLERRDRNFLAHLEDVDGA